MPTRPAPLTLPDTWWNTTRQDTAQQHDRKPDTDQSRPQREHAYPEDKLPLGQINLYAIDRLTLTVPSTIIDPGSPARPLPMIDARITAMRAKSPEAKDHAWRHLGQLARTERGDWNLFALGMAYPGLRAKITPYVKNKALTWPEAVAIHYTMAIEFLTALHRLDLARPYLLSRFIGAAYDQATGRKKSPEPDLLSLQQMKEEDWEAAERQESAADMRKVRQVLSRLIRETRDAKDGYRITERHAKLIARTYIGGESLNTVAAALGMTQSNASKQRTRAENLIAVQLGRADLVTGRASNGDEPQES